MVESCLILGVRGKAYQFLLLIFLSGNHKLLVVMSFSFTRSSKSYHRKGKCSPVTKSFPTHKFSVSGFNRGLDQICVLGYR